MSDQHEAIQQLLAGYVLRSLSGADAAEADHLLTDHVPWCAGCRMTLDAFQAVAADLALDAPTIAPPDTLLPRLHRELEPRGRRFVGRWSPARLVAVAASLMLLVGVGGLAVTQLGGSGSALAPADLQAALHAATQRGATQTPIGPATEIHAPGVQEFYIYGENVTMPPPGTTYRLWAVSGGPARYLGEFVPTAQGLVVLRVSLDPSSFDQLLVTIEPASSEPSEPGESTWSSAA